MDWVVKYLLPLLFAVAIQAQDLTVVNAYVNTLTNTPRTVTFGGGGGGGGTVTFDTSATNGVANLGTTNVGITVASATDRCLIAAVTLGDTGNAPVIVGVTNISTGTAFTFITNKATSASGVVGAYYYKNPPTGSNNISVTCTFGGSPTLTLCVTSWSQVNQTTPVQGNGQAATGSGTTSSVTVNSVANDAVLAVHGGGSAFSAVNQTSVGRLNINGNTSCGNAAWNRAAGNTTVQLTGTLASDSWASIGLDLQHD